MEVVRHMNGDVNNFFDKIEESIISDITSSTGEKVDISQVTSGYTYIKELTSQLGKRGKVKVVIDEYIRPIKYTASFISAQGKNTLSYEVKEIDKTCFEVKYNESFDGISKSKTWNHKLMSKLYKRSSIKKINLVLNNIEAMIQK